MRLRYYVSRGDTWHSFALQCSFFTQLALMHCPRSIIYIWTQPVTMYMVTKLCECLYATRTLTCIVYSALVENCIVRSFCAASAAVVLTRRFAYIRAHRVHHGPIIFRRFSALKASIPENRRGFPGIFSRYRAGETYSDTQVSRTWISEYAGNVCGFFYTS